MRKLSDINEGIFTNGIHRKNQGKEKKEDSLEVKLRDFCDRHYRNIDDYTITDDRLVDCDGNVTIYEDDIVNDKLPFPFGIVNGNFYFELKKHFYGNRKITSLEGCPRIVKGDFCCINCTNIENLEGSPEIVEKNFMCAFCENLKTLKGCTQDIRGNFNCVNCVQLETLEGVADTAKGNFDCMGCLMLTSLKGSPSCVEGVFSCKNCLALETLKGGPTRTVKGFDCSGCTNLMSLDFCPSETGADFDCYDCGGNFTNQDIQERVKKII